METKDIIALIEESFELWYNTNIAKEHPVSVAVSYSDTQTLALKAYHRAALEVAVIEIKEGKAVTTPIISLEENYNHGVTSEQEAKEMMAKKLLVELYSYKD